MNLIFNQPKKISDHSSGPTSSQKDAYSEKLSSHSQAEMLDQQETEQTIKASRIVKPSLEGMLQESHTLRSYIESNELQDLTAPEIPHYQNEELLSFIAEKDPGIFDFLPTLFKDSKPAALVLIPREIRTLSDFNANFANDPDFMKKLELASKGIKDPSDLAQTIRAKTVVEPTLENTLKKEASTLRSYVESNALQDLTEPEVPHNQNAQLLSFIAEKDPGIFDFLPTLFKDSKPAALVLIPREIRTLSDFNADFAKDSEFLAKLDLSTKKFQS